MKKTRINKIIEDKVINVISKEFLEKGYIYKKSKKCFEKKETELLHQICIDNDFEIYMDENLDRFYDLYLVFEIYLRSEFYKFEDWYYENFSKGDLTRIKTYFKSVKFCLPLQSDVDFFIPDDFHPNQNTIIDEKQKFVSLRENMVYEFNDFGNVIEIDDFDFHRTKVIDYCDEQLNYQYDFNKMALDEIGYFKPQALLIYNKMFDIPRKYVSNKIKDLSEKIQIATDEKEKKEFIGALEYFTEIEKKYLN
jgi:hypothetical protein